jgi:hypothetical protein
MERGAEKEVLYIQIHEHKHDRRKNNTEAIVQGKSAEYSRR